MYNDDMKRSYLAYSSLTALFLSLSCVACSSGSEPRKDYYEDEDGICFLAYNNGTEAWVTDYKGDKANLKIPESVPIDGTRLPVRRIEHHAFSQRTVLKSIQLPSSVTSVGEGAFEATSLESLYVTENLLEIPSSAWASTSFSPKNESGISYLEAIDNPYCIAYAQTSAPKDYQCPSGVKSIYAETFKNVTFSTIPDFSGIRFIGDRGLAGATISGEINLPNVVEVGSKAFEDAQGITAIHISDDAKIQSDTLYKCGSINELSIPMPQDASNFNDQSFGQKLALDYLSLSGGDIPQGFFAGPSSRISVKNLALNNIKKIGYQAFSRHNELQSLDLNDVEEIGRESFSFASLKEAYVPTSVKTFRRLAFYTDDDFTLNIGKTLSELQSDISLSYELDGQGSKTIIRYGVVKSDEYVDGDFKYKVDASGYATLTSYTGESNVVTIPERLGGKTVKTIAKTAFQDKTSIASLTILPKVSFEKEALAPLHNLQELSLDVQSLRTTYDQTGNVDFWYAFGNLPFSDSYAITRDDILYYIPNSLQKLALSASDQNQKVPEFTFSGFSSLVNVTLPKNGSTIGNSAFRSCVNVKDVYVPPKTKPEGQYALGFGPNTIIRLDNSLGGYSGLSQWTESKYVYNVDGDVPVPVDSQGVTYSYDETGQATVVSILPGAKDVVIPEEFNGHPVTTINANAFADAGTTLESLVIPSSVTTIQANAFAGLRVLKKLTIPFVGTSSVYNENGYPFGVAFGLQQGDWCYYVGTYALPLSLEQVYVSEATKLPKKAFSGCEHIKRIILNENVDYLGADAFEECSELTGFYWGESLGNNVYWPDYFYRCKPVLYASYAEGELLPYHYRGETKVMDFDTVYYGKTYADYLNDYLL